MQILTNLLLLVSTVFFAGCMATNPAGEKGVSTLNKSGLSKVGDSFYKLNMKNAVTNTATKNTLIGYVKRNEPAQPIPVAPPKPPVQSSKSQPEALMSPNLKEAARDGPPQAAALQPKSPQPNIVPHQVGTNDSTAVITVIKTGDGKINESHGSNPIGLFIYYLSVTCILVAAYLGHKYYKKIQEIRTARNPFIDKVDKTHLGSGI